MRSLLGHYYITTMNQLIGSEGLIKTLLDLSMRLNQVIFN